MFKALLKTRFEALLSAMTNGSNLRGKKGKKKRGKGYLVLLAVAMVYVIGVFAVAFGGMFSAMLPVFSENGCEWAYFAYAAVLDFALMVVASVFMTKTQLYEAKDNDLLLSMPIKPSMILASRAVMLLGFNFFYSLAVIIPAAAVYATQKGITLFGAVAFVLVFAALMLFTFAVSGILGWLLAKISVHVKNKSIVSLLFFVVFFVAYMYFVSNAEGVIAAIVSNSGALAEAFAKIAPLYWIGTAISNRSILSLVLALCVLVLPFMVVWFVLENTFVKTATAKRGFAKRKYNMGQIKQSTQMGALIKREAGTLMGSSAYLLNAATGAIFAFMIGVSAIVVTALGILDIAAYVPPFMVPAVICFLACMTLISSASVSIEGKTLWISRSMPVSTRQILQSKLIFHILVAVPANLFLGVALAICLKMDALSGVMTVLFAVAINLFGAVLGLAENLRHPMMSWTNETQAVKSGMATLFTMLIGMAVAIAVAVGSVFLSLLAGDWLPMLVFTVIFTAISAAIYSWILKGGVKRYENL